MSPYRVFNAVCLALLATAAALPVVVSGQSHRPVRLPAASVRSNYAAADAARDREIAAHFSPAFHQGLGDSRRGDLITNFDFDGDWRGDNNWANADDRRHKLKAYVYYAVSETETHFFIHYAVFHPRDYKGGAGGALLSEAIKEGVKLGGRYDPTGLARARPSSRTRTTWRAVSSSPLRATASARARSLARESSRRP